MAGQTKNSVSSKNKCQHCGKEFTKETTLLTHTCEPKRRLQQRDEQGVRLGFRAYQIFYNSLGNTQADKTYEEFIDSPYYLAFVKFGRYLVEIRAVGPEPFCHWLIRNQKKLDHWTRDSIYQEFLTEYIKKESVADALERSIDTMNSWAQQQQARYQDYFKYATNSRICFDIQTARISAWVIYGSNSGQKFLAQLSVPELESIWPYINSDDWQRVIARKNQDFIWAQEILEKAGL